MNKGGSKNKDVATTSTQANAFPTLQENVKSQLSSFRGPEDARPSVGIIGPGARDDKTGLSPQSSETLATMQALPRKSVLNIYHYDSTTMPTGSAPVRGQAIEKDHGQVTVRHHLFDLTAPGGTETTQNDLVIATRVMAPVMTAAGISKKKGVVGALFDKVKPEGRIFTDAFALGRMQAADASRFGEVSKTGASTKDLALIKPRTEGASGAAVSSGSRQTVLAPPPKKKSTAPATTMPAVTTSSSPRGKAASRPLPAIEQPKSAAQKRKEYDQKLKASGRKA